MNLRSGTRFGPYEIVAPIGAGGMGEVYKARDTRLGRTVAIKILPAAYSSDAKLRLRFEREAKVISSLSHPHICVLHDVGSEDGLDYLVLEHCDGQTLAQRLERGPLPVDEVLQYAAQIAEALAKAHRSGVIHRDLKPSNIIITKSGVKLLDFGLAEVRGVVAASGSSETATVDKPLSGDGQIAGTIQYMAPETLTTGHVDARSDIFALGLVLHEMLTGNRAFSGTSKAGVIAAILEREPPPLRVASSPQLEHIVMRCIRKDPDERWQTAADIAAELRWLQTSPGREISPPKRKLWRWASIAAVIAAAAVVGLLVPRGTPPPTVERRVVSVFVPEAPIAIREWFGVRSMAIAPDSRSMVYVASDPPRLYLRSFAETQGKPIAGSEGAITPFFSPDGRWIGFVRDGKLLKAPVAGGDPQTISDSPGGFYMPVWAETNTIAFNRGHSLYQVSASGGTPALLAEAPPDVYYLIPQFLPGGKKLLFERRVEGLNPNQSEIAVLDMTTGKISVLMKGGSQPRYSPTGHLLFAQTAPANVRTATIFSVSFDAQSLVVSGVPVPRVVDAQAHPIGGFGYWTVGADGSILYVPADRAYIERELVWLDRYGRVSPASPRTAFYNDVRLAPTGTRVAYSDVSSVWVGDLARDVWLRLAEGFWAQSPVWSPDGSRIAYDSYEPMGIAIAPADGSAPPKQLLVSKRQVLTHSWSPDGRLIAFDASAPLTDVADQGIWLVDVRTAARTHWLRDPSARMPAFSPNGRHIAYVTGGARATGTAGTIGDAQVHVQGYPEPGARHTVFTGARCRTTTTCANVPRWSADGRTLYFKSGSKVVAVDIETASGKFRAGVPRVLFETEFEFDDLNVAPNGEGFLVSRWKQKPQWDHFNMVSGWWAN